MSLGWNGPKDVVSVGVFEDTSSLTVSFRFNVSASGELSPLSVWVPVVTWQSHKTATSSPWIPSMTTVLVAWDCMAGLVSCTVLTEAVFPMPQSMVGVLVARACSGNVVVSRQSPLTGVASVESRVGSALSSPDTRAVEVSALQNKAASSSDISTYPSKCHWYGNAGVKHLSFSLLVVTACCSGLHSGQVSLLQGLEVRRDRPSA